MIIVLMVAPHCAVPIRGPRTSVTLHGGGGRVEDTQVGCEGERLLKQEHEQSMGGVSIDYAHDAFTRGASVMVLHGRVTALSGEQAEGAAASLTRSSYTLVAGGFRIGIDSRYIGGELGAVAYVGGGDLETIPSLLLRVGDLDQVWWETGLGHVYGAFDPTLFSTVLAYREPELQFRVGIALSKQVIMDFRQDGKRIALGGSDDEGDTLAGFYARLNLRVHEGVSLTARALLGPNMQILIGASFDLEPDPVPQRSGRPRARF